MKCVTRWDELGRIFEALKDRGLILLGPVLREGAILIDEISAPADLPIGWTDRQKPGAYRLQTRPDPVAFGFHSGQDSWKRFLLQPRCTLWKAQRTPQGFEVLPKSDPPPPMAFIGMRACDVAAMERLDRVFGVDSAPSGMRAASCIDPTYATRRGNAFIVAVQCTQPGGNCFCSSMGSGPAVRSGFDLVMTELLEPEGHLFLVESGSRAGEELLRQCSLAEAQPEICERAKSLLQRCADRMGKSLDTSGIREMLPRNWDNPRWQLTAQRCLTCGNCTMVCPTCFCTNVLDETDLTGQEARRIRLWDSCFSLEYSYVHGGGNVRTSAQSRYRHWMTHKLATWIDQFGELGCVGCGRCITWCPAGIDLTEEAAAIRESDSTPTISSEEKCYVRS